MDDDDLDDDENPKEKESTKFSLRIGHSFIQTNVLNNSPIIYSSNLNINYKLNHINFFKFIPTSKYNNCYYKKISKKYGIFLVMKNNVMFGCVTEDMYNYIPKNEIVCKWFLDDCYRQWFTYYCEYEKENEFLCVFLRYNMEYYNCLCEKEIDEKRKKDGEEGKGKGEGFIEMEKMKLSSSQVDLNKVIVKSKEVKEKKKGSFLWNSGGKGQESKKSFSYITEGFKRFKNPEGFFFEKKVVKWSSNDMLEYIKLCEYYPMKSLYDLSFVRTRFRSINGKIVPVYKHDIKGFIEQCSINAHVRKEKDRIVIVKCIAKSLEMLQLKQEDLINILRQSRANLFLKGIKSEFVKVFAENIHIKHNLTTEEESKLKVREKIQKIGVVLKELYFTEIIFIKQIKEMFEKIVKLMCSQKEYFDHPVVRRIKSASFSLVRVNIDFIIGLQDIIRGDSLFYSVETQKLIYEYVYDFYKEKKFHFYFFFQKEYKPFLSFVLNNAAKIDEVLCIKHSYYKFDNLLIMPFQRIVKYELFFQRIERMEKDNHLVRKIMLFCKVFNTKINFKNMSLGKDIYDLSSIIEYLDHNYEYALVERIHNTSTYVSHLLNCKNLFESKIIEVFLFADKLIIGDKENKTLTEINFEEEEKMVLIFVTSSYFNIKVYIDSQPMYEYLFETNINSVDFIQNLEKFNKSEFDDSEGRIVVDFYPFKEKIQQSLSHLKDSTTTDDDEEEG